VWIRERQAAGEVHTHGQHALVTLAQLTDLKWRSAVGALNYKSVIRVEVWILKCAA
jgi:hypothetical protein